MTTILPAAIAAPKAALAGHIGVGHAYSHSGFVQEDSVGFAALLHILQRACPMNFTVTKVDGEGDTVRVHTAQGGVGEGTALRGFTPFERDMMQRAVGQVCLAPQTAAVRIFGRIYGQGVCEPAAAFSLALAKAYVHTVQLAWPEATLHAPEDVAGGCGEFLGGNMSVHNEPVAWLLSVNASPGGIGPVEDAEGIIPIGNKGELMAALGMDTCPALILESKAYNPKLSDALAETTYYARWNEEHDNAVVGACLRMALEESGLPFKVQADAYPRNGALTDETKRIGDVIAQLGQEYASAQTASHKVTLAYRLACIASQDLGGSIFMSDVIFELAGAGGLWPGQAAVLSSLTSQDDLRRMGTLTVTEEELRRLADIALATACHMTQQHAAALRILEDKRPAHTPQQLLDLVSNSGATPPSL
ncbi:hypothetical protein [Desulfovibrio cuneatus]|uniref:hypothetical protein n=1 Tax=Desulfovibrio cuneatus TaxID=159728 RepID=UPI00040F410C|nr:hypothetical protein [Desulfovibrio cuneatus]